MMFSFVLPAYKGRYIRESINSILLQDFADFELIVVDDCSPEHIYDIVSEFDDKRITYYRNKKNIGGKDLVAQWNHCLEYAKGDYVILATDDDLYEPSFLSTFASLIKRYPFVGLFRARVLAVDSENKIKQIDHCFKEYLSETEFRYYMMHGIRGGVPQYVFRRDMLVVKGGFVNLPMAWGSDDATAMMMALHGVVNSQEHLVRFRYSDINISSDQHHTGIDKLKARLLLAQWMKEHEIVIPHQKDWAVFYQREINDYLPIYIKSILITRLAAIPWQQWPNALYLIWKNNLIPWADKCSVMYHSIKNKK